jgi:hypothetical protein
MRVVGSPGRLPDFADNGFAPYSDSERYLSGRYSWLISLHVVLQGDTSVFPEGI